MHQSIVEITIETVISALSCLRSSEAGHQGLEALSNENAYTFFSYSTRHEYADHIFSPCIQYKVRSETLSDLTAKLAITIPMNPGRAGARCLGKIHRLAGTNCKGFSPLMYKYEFLFCDHINRIDFHGLPYVV